MNVYRFLAVLLLMSAALLASCQRKAVVSTPTLVVGKVSHLLTSTPDLQGTIYVEDLNGYVASGVVGLGDNAKIVHRHQVSDTPDGPKRMVFVYQLNHLHGHPSLIDMSTGKFIDLDAVTGETIYLMGNSKLGAPEHVAYYTCITAQYPNCTIIIVDTPILTGR